MRAILEPQLLVDTSLQELMREMLVRLGEDPERDGLQDTPSAWKRSMQYLTKGYQENPEEVDVAYDEMVIPRGCVLRGSLGHASIEILHGRVDLTIVASALDHE
jgi:GTP cyclohydrolase I